jgi:hypothetical protein
MVGSTGLSRFFQSEPQDTRKSETIIIDNVDSSLAIEGNARSPGVSSLLSIITDPMRQVVILVSTVDDPFKCLGASSAGKTIRSSITLRVHIGCHPNATVSSKKTKGAVKAVNDQHVDTLYVLELEAASGYHSNDSLLSVAHDMRRILLKE